MHCQFVTLTTLTFCTLELFARCHQNVYFNKRTKKATRANPAKVLAAAQAAYDDAWEFISYPDRYAANAAKAAAQAAALKDWQQLYDAQFQSMYWYNSATGDAQGEGHVFRLLVIEQLCGGCT